MTKADPFKAFYNFVIDRTINSSNLIHSVSSRVLVAILLSKITLLELNFDLIKQSAFFLYLSFIASHIYLWFLKKDF